MYSTSTQKATWIFESIQHIDRIRCETNANFRRTYAAVIEPGEEVNFLTSTEETQLCQLVTRTGIRFSDDFRPQMWPSVRWVAFAYFKRFFMRHSVMEYSPKSIMMSCFYLAAKIEEFNVSIDDFVANLRSGSPQQNMETILTWEPIIMHKLDYNLTVHSPFRPLDGHLLEIQLMTVINVEQIRANSLLFLQNLLLTDVMLLNSPTHIALAALKYSFRLADDKERVFDRYIADILFPNNAESVIKLTTRLDTMIEMCDEALLQLEEEQTSRLQDRMQDWLKLHTLLESRRQTTTVTRIIGDDQSGSKSSAADVPAESDDDDSK